MSEDAENKYGGRNCICPPNNRDPDCVCMRKTNSYSTFLMIEYKPHSSGGSHE